jgi:hypothetical protein
VAVALHGNLRDFGIAEVFQLIGQQRKTGLLEISGDDHDVRLAFDAGAVVWATPVGKSEFAVLGDRLVRCGLITRPALEDLIRESTSSARALPSLLVASGNVAEADLEEITELLSRETIFNVMRWAGGSFHFTAQAVHHETPPEKLLAAEQILMDGLRMIDEWGTFKDLVPSDETVFRPIDRLDVYRQKVVASSSLNSPAAERIFQLVDGRLPVLRIVDLSRLGTFEATRILAELHRVRLIAICAEQKASKPAAGQSSRPPIGEWIKFGLAALIPMLALAGVAKLAVDAPLTPSVQSGHMIPMSPLSDVREQFQRRRLFSAMNAARLNSGEWPADLTSGADLGAVGRFAMAPQDAAPYYYVKRGEEALLLTPRR